jgi:hypothetical protein
MPSPRNRGLFFGDAIVRYDRIVIKNSTAYARQSQEERWEALRRMSVKDSIAIGEALLTSDVMRLAKFPDDDQPLSLAIALRIGSKVVERQAVPDHGGQ